MRSLLFGTSIFVAVLAAAGCSRNSSSGLGGIGGVDGSNADGQGGSNAGGQGGTSVGGQGGSVANDDAGTDPVDASAVGGKGGDHKDGGAVGGSSGAGGAVVGVDAAVGGTGGAVSGVDAAVVGVDAAVAGADTAVVGVDAAVVGVDAAVVGVDAAVVGVDAAVVGADGPTSGADSGAAGSCAYKDDQSFCACMKWTCGGMTIKDSAGTLRTVYCGGCMGGQFCQTQGTQSAGTCGGSNPLMYEWQRQKIDILVAMGENDSVIPAFDYAEHLKDGRGYTVGKVGFCSGTGDFIIVAQCYNDLKPGNVLAKYMGHRDTTGKAIDGLLHYNDLFWTTMMNQGDVKLIDSLAMGSGFVADCATAAKDAEYRKCQDDMADVLYLVSAIKHANERGLRGALTLGFIYDTELNFGDGDDPGGIPGAATTIALADKDYGATMPKDFTGKPWEESKWLGYLIKERAIIMSKDRTWRTDMDQNATWEGARRLHTGTSSAVETDTDLSMNYDISSAYKAGSMTAGTPCWPTELAVNTDSRSTLYTITTDKSASATDRTKWTSAGALGSGGFMACPPNPTP